MTTRNSLSRPDRYFSNLIERAGHPMVSRRFLFILLQRMHDEAAANNLRLPKSGPTDTELFRRCGRLLAAGILRKDQDYQRRFRVMGVPDLPADEIACLADRFCYISHLSAMQRWELTDRIPASLIISRPDRRSIAARIQAIMAKEGAPEYPLQNVNHPDLVRERRIRLVETRHPGASIDIRGSFARISSIGQTFLDMLHLPGLCGGMSHVRDMWDQHAGAFLDDIIASVDRDTSGVVKCRAGYMLEERLSVHDPRIEAWRAFAQRGGSRKLDPKRPFVPQHSVSWMLSLNVP